MTRAGDLKAFLFAVPVAAAAFPLTVAISVALREKYLMLDIYGASIYFFASLPIITTAGLLIGVPIVVALRRLRLMYFPILISAGFLSGGAVSGLILSGGIVPGLGVLPIGAIPGLAAAITWWALTEHRQKTND